MKRLVLILTICFTSATVWGNSLDTARYYKTLKKNRAQMQDFFNVFPGAQRVSPELKDLDRSLQDAETALRAGMRKQGAVILKKAGGHQNLTYRAVVKYMLNKADEILFKLSEEIQRNEPASKEGIVLFRKARQEAMRSRKFFRDRNFPYSLHLTKVSIRFAIRAYQTFQFTLPVSFVPASKAWFKKKKKREDGLAGPAEGFKLGGMESSEG